MVLREYVLYQLEHDMTFELICKNQQMKNKVDFSRQRQEQQQQSHL